MDAEVMTGLAKMGGAMALGFAAIGSALGTGTAGMAGIGAWKKCYAQNKSAPFILLVFIGAPLSQTIYGLLLMNSISKAAESAQMWPVMLGTGVIGGIAMGMSAWYQGKAGAAGCDALGETGQGFSNYLTTLGVVETVALFVMIFIQGVLK
ncbi:MAG: V/A-type H+/Na+-transporting ATPase subunit [Verrucomicrobiota bacterium]|jgi:V/A-type H+-transporting ATPase subunit K|nr:V/A-type H+/Na+-transporting ATPase subunit [Verrucomicrobiota bacterium]MDK2963535.1 V/A-type H+/Na+-transporting ATPase subunit [Verrucomicrobiota bacterium]